MIAYGRKTPVNDTADRPPARRRFVMSSDGTYRPDWSDRHEVMYATKIQCDVCLEHFGVTFHDLESAFSGTCPHCDTHFPELFV